MSRTLREVVYHAKKMRLCYECCKPIVIGEAYTYNVAIVEGEFCYGGFCAKCLPLPLQGYKITRMVFDEQT